jgi:hypothetical protein
MNFNWKKNLQLTLKYLKKKSFSRVILKYLPIIVHIIFFAEF